MNTAFRIDPCEINMRRFMTGSIWGNYRIISIQTPEFIRRDTRFLFKKTGEMLRVFKTQIVSDLTDGFVPVEN